MKGSRGEREAGTTGLRGPRGKKLLLVVLYRDRTTTLALARVLARAAAVARLAAALALAGVLALAAVLLGRRAAALALAGVLARAAAVARLAAAVALTRVHALTGMLFLALGLLLFGGELGTGDHAGHDGAHDLREFSAIHS